jgi:hypothetical protein
MRTSIVPNTGNEHTTYLLMDEIGEYGNVWREMSEGEANEATIVKWMIDGEINRPVKIVAFNTEEGWSRDITHDVASKLLELNQNGVALGAAAREFVVRITRRPTTAFV